MQTIIKDPSAALDYGFDWSEWLGADTISTSTWTAPTGITQDSSTNTDTVSTVWLSSGVAGKSYRVVNQVVTAQGRTDERSIKVSVRNR